MSDTWAVQSDILERANLGEGNGGRPLCPACFGGRLHPYLVVIGLSDHPHGWHGANYLRGFVAVCVGRKRDDMISEDLQPCGFSMPMTAHSYPASEGMAP